MATERIIFDFQTRQNVSKTLQQIGSQLSGTIKQTNAFNSALRRAFEGDFSSSIRGLSRALTGFSSGIRDSRASFTGLAPEIRKVSTASNTVGRSIDNLSRRNAKLREFGNTIRRTFSTDLVRNLSNFSTQMQRVSAAFREIQRDSSKTNTNIRRITGNTTRAAASFQKFQVRVRQTSARIRQATATVRKFDAAVVRTNKSVFSGIPILRGLTSAFRGYIGFLGARTFLNAADEWTRIGTSIRLVSGQSSSLNNIQGRLFEIAQNTRSELSTTATLYRRIGLNTRNLGLSQTRLLGIIQTIQQSIQVTGITAEEARGGIIQLGQALASGALRGDELRSIMENMPAIAQAIAAEFEVGIGDLRRLGREGALTSGRIVNAIENAAPEISRQFQNVEQLGVNAFTRIGNSFTRTIGEINRSLGLSTGLNNFATIISENIPTAISIASGAITTLMVPALIRLGTSLAATAVSLSLATAGISVLAGATAAYIVNSKINDLTNAQQRLNTTFDETGKITRSSLSDLNNISLERLATSINAINERIETLRNQEIGDVFGESREQFAREFSELDNQLQAQSRRFAELQLEQFRTIGRGIRNFFTSSTQETAQSITETSQLTADQLKEVVTFYRTINDFPERYFDAFATSQRNALASNVEFQARTREQQEQIIANLVAGEREARTGAERYESVLRRINNELQSISSVGFGLPEGQEISLGFEEVDSSVLERLNRDIESFNNNLSFTRQEIRETFRRELTENIRRNSQQISNLPRTFDGALQSVSLGFQNFNASIALGLDDVSERWSDVWGGIRQVTSQTLNSLSDGVVAFATGAEFSWRRASNSILDSLIRLQSNRIFSDLLNLALNSISGLGSTTGSTASPGGGFQPGSDLLGNPLSSTGAGSETSGFGFDSPSPNVGAGMPSPTLQPQQQQIVVNLIIGEAQARRIIREGSSEVISIIAEDTNVLQGLSLT